MSLQILSFLSAKFPDKSHFLIEEDKIQLYLDILNSTNYYAIKSCKDLVATLSELHPKLFLQFFEFFIPKDTEEVIPSDIKYINSILELLPQDDENVMEDLWTFFKSKTGTDIDLSINDGVIYILSRAIQLNMQPIIIRYLNDPDYHQKNVLASLFSTLAMHISVAYSVLNSLLFVLPDDFDFENFIPFPRVQVNISTAKSDLCRDILIFLSHLLERAPFLAHTFFIKDGLVFNVIDFMSYAQFSIQEAACALMSRLIQVSDPSFFENLDQMKIISDLINVLDENRQDLTEFILVSISILFFRLPIELLRENLDVDILLSLYDADLSEKSLLILKDILTALNP